jgi:hypothetical protein
MEGCENWRQYVQEAGTIRYAVTVVSIVNAFPIVKAGMLLKEGEKPDRCLIPTSTL